LLNRYLESVVSAADTDNIKAQAARQEILRLAKGASAASRNLYNLAYSRWERSLPKPRMNREFEATYRLIVGLGGHHVLETGLTLHHTYGTPLIPGTALKGLAAKYCHEVWGNTADGANYEKFSGAPGEEGECFRVLFGTQDEGGLMTFHDAWITPGSLTKALVDDVITPHHSEYYSGKQEEPTDFDSPIPIPFLSVSGTFLVALSADRSRPNPDKWLDLAFTLVTQSLREWGVGGKTSSGYGRLTPVAG